MTRSHPGRAFRSGSSQFAQFSTRLPPATVDKVRAIAQAEGIPMWRVIADSVAAYEAPSGDDPATEQAA